METNSAIPIMTKTSQIHPRPLFNFFKRLSDILISGLGLLILAPFFGIIVLAIKREGPGPIFYRGPRMGRFGREFGILKFRTMREDPESYNGPRVTAKNDKRVTPLGQWLRDTKLNELPQLWNVFIGEMSLVGPRPEDPEIAKNWPEDASAEILSMRPGITSPASVAYRDEEHRLSGDNVMAQYMQEILPDKLRLDRLYVRHCSFFGDLDILFWTAVALLPRVERQIPEGKLFAGPLYQIARRNISWFFIDLVASLAAVVVATVFWRFFDVIDWGILPLSILAAFLALLFSIMNFLLGLDRIIWSRASAEEGLVLIFSNAISIAVVLLVNAFRDVYFSWFPYPSLPIRLIALIGILTMLAGLLTRYRLRLITSFASRWLNWRGGRGGVGERVLILGAGEGGQIINWLLRRETLRTTFTVIGMVDDDPAKQGMRIDGCTVLGNTTDIPPLVKKHDVGVILFAITNLSEGARQRALRLSESTGARVVFLNDILGTVHGRLAAPARG